MEALSSFNIPFARASAGENRHQFKLENEFFSSIEDAMVQNGSFTVNVVLDKHSNYSFLHFQINGKIEADCDRCLMQRHWPVDAAYTLLIKYDQDVPNDTDEDVLYIPADTQEINVRAHLYEYVSISLPMAKYCEDIEESCNEEVTKYLDQETTHISNPLADQLKEVKFN